MKKIISILLAAALVLSFAACARQGTNENTNETESTTAAQGEASTGADEKAIISVGSADIADKSGTAVERGTQTGTDYKNDSLGIKITPPESFESFADGEEGEGVPSTNNDYFAIELTENHDNVTYKTVTVSITENAPYSDVQAYISHVQADGYMQTNAVGEVNIGGRVYTCVKYVYPESPDVNSVDYIAVENGTLVILGFDQLTDGEIAEFFANCVEQY